ncbi:hypothetical protein BDV96DRAFT_694538, partial [Lophiotrema nucula]
DSSQWLCNACGIPFSTERLRNNHIERKHERPFICSVPICKARFGSKPDLRRHEHTVHKSDILGWSNTWVCSNVGCSSPGLVFRRKDNYKRHLLRCTGTPALTAT